MELYYINESIPTILGIKFSNASDLIFTNLAETRFDQVSSNKSSQSLGWISLSTDFKLVDADKNV